MWLSSSVHGFFLNNSQLCSRWSSWTRRSRLLQPHTRNHQSTCALSGSFRIPINDGSVLTFWSWFFLFQGCLQKWEDLHSDPLQGSMYISQSHRSHSNDVLLRWTNSSLPIVTCWSPTWMGWSDRRSRRRKRPLSSSCYSLVPLLGSVAIGDAF